MKRFFVWIHFLIMFSGFLFLGFETGRLSAIHGWAWYHIPLFISYFVVSFFLQVIVHEGGHLVAGLLSGYSFSMFKLLSFIWVKESGKVTVKKQHAPGLLGQCLMVPPKDISSPPYALYHLGGIIANLTAAALAYVVWMLPVPALVRLGFLNFAVTGGILAVINLIPLGANDGMNLWKSSRSMEHRIQMNQLLQIHAGLSKGETGQELQGLVYFVAEEPLTEGNNATMQSVQALKYTENLEFDQAERTLRPLWEQFDHLLDVHKIEVLKEYLFVLLLSKPDDPAVDEIVSNKWFKKYTGIKQADTKRVLAAYALIKERDLEKASRLLDEAEKYIDKAPTLTDQNNEKKLANYLREKVDKEKLLQEKV